MTMTIRQLQIARRLHHRTKETLATAGPRTAIEVEAGDLEAVLKALWCEIDRANAAEDLLAGKPVVRRVPYLRILPESRPELPTPA